MQLFQRFVKEIGSFEKLKPWADQPPGTAHGVAHHTASVQLQLHEYLKQHGPVMPAAAFSFTQHTAFQKLLFFKIDYCFHKLALGADFCFAPPPVVACWQRQVVLLKR